MAARQAQKAAEMGRIIASDADLKAGIAFLKPRCPGMAQAHAVVGDPPLRRWSPGFDGLVRIIVGQQLSTSSAAAILARLTLAVVPLSPDTLMATGDAVLRSAGLSAAKIATLRALARAAIDGQVDLAALMALPQADVRRQLTAIRGIGPWTADIYLLFCRGDADAFAAGDLALQISAQTVLALPERPTADELQVIAERWRPWRGVAARLLWAHYGHVKHAAKKSVGRT